MDMVEGEQKELPEGGSEDGALHDHIAHWLEVLDLWVKSVDLGMGERTRGARVRDGDEDSAKGVEG